MNTNKMTRLSANENCYGCSPMALQAGMQQFNNICTYPDVHPSGLKERLAAHYGVSKDNVVTGAGSVRIIEGLIQSFVGAGEELLTFDNTFSIYRQLAQTLGRRCQLAPLTDMVCRPENLLRLITGSTRLVFISNPNNPTGTIITHAELENFLHQLPENIIVAIDEAYAEYVTDPSFPDSFSLQKKYPNLVILRSFSKIYGLAALRAGYAVLADHLARHLEANQLPFSVTNMASAAAVAALADTGFVSRSAKRNAAQRDLLYSGLAGLGYFVVPSEANFLYVAFDSINEKNEVRDILFKNSLLVCDLEKFGQSTALRITVGKEEANQQILSVLEKTIAVC